MSSHSGLIGSPDELSSNNDTNGDTKSNSSKDGNVILDTSVPIAPDGGWGWVVVFGAFFCLFIVDGMMFSFDILRASFEAEFPDVQPFEIQIMGSLGPGLSLILSPFANALLNLYGARPLVVVGSVLGAISCLVSGFIENFYGLMFFYGILLGISYTLIFSPAILIVGFYFNKHRATATGITVCGSCLGTLALSKLMFYLNDYYGSWRAVLIILAGVMLNCSLFGCLFRPLPNVIITQVVVGDGSDDVDKVSEEVKAEERNGNILSNFYTKADNHIVNIAASGPLFNTRPRVHSIQHISRSISVEQARSAFSSRGSILQQQLGSGIMYRRDAYYTGNVQHTLQYREAQAIAAATNIKDVDSIYLRSMTFIPTDAKSIGEIDGVDDEKGCKQLKPIRDVIAQLDPSLLKNPKFLIIGSAAFIAMLGYFTPFFYSNTYGQRNGLSPSEGLWVLNCIAMANGVGRILCGVLTDFPWADSLAVNNVSMIISGILNIILPFVAQYGPIVFYSYGALYGLFIAPYVSLRSIIVVDLLGIEKLSSAFGFILLFIGVAASIGSPILMAVQSISSFDTIFYISGGVLVLSGLVCLPVKSCGKRKKRRA